MHFHLFKTMHARGKKGWFHRPHYLRVYIRIIYLNVCYQIFLFSLLYSQVNADDSKPGWKSVIYIPNHRNLYEIIDYNILLQASTYVITVKRYYNLQGDDFNTMKTIIIYIYTSIMYLYSIIYFYCFSF